MADEPRGDVVELGGQRLIQQGWRPSRGAGVLAAATLVAGLAAGYVAGDRHASRGTAVPRPVVTVTKLVTPPPSAPTGTFAFANTPLVQPPGACSVQHGRKLELGVQVANLSAETVTLRAVKAVLPLGGLKQVSQTWAPCGTLPDGLVPGPVTLQPGASTWLSVTFNVQKGCPAPYPVQFSVGYRAGGRAATASLPGFPDLGSVPYSACPPSGQLAEQRVVLITP